MKRGIIICFVLLSPFGAMSQLDCDTSLCVKYADTTSFEILGLAHQTDMANPNSNYMISCKMLCEIEAARSSYVDVTINIGSYSVLIYKREEQEMEKEK
jgi:hypothetical protein